MAVVVLLVVITELNSRESEKCEMNIERTKGIRECFFRNEMRMRKFDKDC